MCCGRPDRAGHSTDFQRINSFPVGGRGDDDCPHRAAIHSAELPLRARGRHLANLVARHPVVVPALAGTVRLRALAVRDYGRRRAPQSARGPALEAADSERAGGEPLRSGPAHHRPLLIVSE